MNQATHTKFANVVIPRFLSLEGKPAVFFADVEPEETVDAYIEGKGIVTVSKAVYDDSEPLHPDDAAQVINFYQGVSGLQNVQQRKRMPYKKEATKLARRLTSELNTNVNEQVLQAASTAVQPVISEMSKQKPVSAKSAAAKRRSLIDDAAAAAVNVKRLDSSVDEETRKQALKELSEKMVAVLLSAM